MKRKDLMLAGVLALIVSAAFAVDLLKKPLLIDETPLSTEVTVYNQNFGVVKEYRKKFLEDGINLVHYEGVAAAIDPTSVKLKSTDGVVNVLEQNYQYDLISKYKILQKYVGKNITAYMVYGGNKELFEGELLSHNGDDLIIKNRDGSIQTLNSNNLVLPKLPGGLITKPTLEWIIDSEGRRNHTLELSYITSGLTWRSDYVAVVNDEDTTIDLNGWVTVTNNAGTTFHDTSLKLVAGNVRRVTPSAAPRAYYEDKEYNVESAGASQFAEEGLFEYHLYDLQRKTTLRNSEQKQISLMESEGVGVEKEFVYENNNYWWSRSASDKVQVKINFENSRENKLGMPLPAGIVRVFKKDSGGKLQFIGEDRIEHTPKDETIRLYLGDAFDVVGERKQLDYNNLGGYYEYEWEVTLKNHKDEGITVTVLEGTYGDWEITRESHKHVKESNNRIKWRIPVKKDGETKLTYTIRYKKN